MTGQLVDTDTGDRRAIVYRLYDAAGALLYVGCTTRVAHRIVEHASKPWASKIARVEVDECADLPEAREVEADAIANEAPLYNVHHRREGWLKAPRATLATLEAHGALLRAELLEEQSKLDAYEETMDHLRPYMESDPDLSVAGALALMEGVTL